jgi:probable HAF family extracellular repeat protein
MFPRTSRRPKSTVSARERFTPQVERLEDRTLLSTGSRLIDIGTLGGDISVPYSINEAGQVAGFSNISVGGHNHAFIWSPDTGMQDLGVLPGGFNSGAYGINDLGQVVGVSTSATGTHAFVWDKVNGMQDLGTLWNGKGRCNAWSINDLGQIVGSCIAPDDFQEEHTLAVIWQGGNEISKIPNQWGTKYSYAYDINDFGEITGWATGPDGEPNAYLYEGGIGGTMINLGTLGGPNSKGYRLNTVHQLVGAASAAGRYDKAFYYSDGVMTQIPTLGGAFNYAYGINNAGWVVGKSFTNPPNIHAYLYKDGQVIDLNNYVQEASSSGWRALTEAKDINNHNQITGWGRRYKQKHGYVLSLNFDVPPQSLITARIPSGLNQSPTGAAPASGASPSGGASSTAPRVAAATPVGPAHVGGSQSHSLLAPKGVSVPDRWTDVAATSPLALFQADVFA